MLCVASIVMCINNISFDVKFETIVQRASVSMGIVLFIID